MSSSVHRSRKNPNSYYGKLCQCHMMFALLAIIIQRAHTEVKADCYAHGCSLTAVDIIYDETAKEALSILRETVSKIISDDDKGLDDHSNVKNRNSVLREKALSALRPAGDDSKTAMTLRGYKGGRGAE